MNIKIEKTLSEKRTYDVGVKFEVTDPIDGKVYKGNDTLRIEETVFFTEFGNKVIYIDIPKLWDTYCRELFRDAKRDLHKEIADAFLSEQYPFGEITLFNVREKGDRIEVYGYVGVERKPTAIAEIDAEGNVTYVNGFVVNEENPTHKDILDKIDEVVAKIEAEGGMIKVDWSIRRY